MNGLGMRSRHMIEVFGIEMPYIAGKCLWFVVILFFAAWVFGRGRS